MRNITFTDSSQCSIWLLSWFVYDPKIWPSFICSSWPKSYRYEYIWLINSFTNIFSFINIFREVIRNRRVICLLCFDLKVNLFSRCVYYQLCFREVRADVRVVLFLIFRGGSFFALPWQRKIWFGFDTYWQRPTRWGMIILEAVKAVFWSVLILSTEKIGVYAFCDYRFYMSSYISVCN